MVMSCLSFWANPAYGKPPFQPVESCREELIAHPAFAKFNNDLGSMRLVATTSQIEVLEG